MALTDANGAVVERVKYDPYGQPTCTRTSDSDVATASHFANPWLFQGQRFCSETGIYYFKNRDHEPNLGRFLQRDPEEYPDGMNVYEMVAGCPIRLVDPYGLAKISSERMQKCCPCAKKPAEGKQMRCKVASGPSYSLTGKIRPVVVGDQKIFPRFGLSAEFVQDPDNGFCATCCEVRQYIMWKNTPPPYHDGFQPASQYNTWTWYEDRDDIDKRYGRREGRYSDPQACDQYTMPDQLCGTKYSGFDQPQSPIILAHGTWKFKLKVHDVCNGNIVVAKSDILVLRW